MANLQTIEKVVLEILEKYPITRKDDYILMYFVCKKMCSPIVALPFGNVLVAHKEVNLPNWKSVERARRKIQEKRPDLADGEMVIIREKEEETYIDYALDLGRNENEI